MIMTSMPSLEERASTNVLEHREPRRPHTLFTPKDETSTKTPFAIRPNDNVCAQDLSGSKLHCTLFRFDVDNARVESDFSPL